MEEKKYFKVECPEGYEIDKENSTWDNICFKKIEQEVRSWDDLIGKNIPATQVWVRNSDSNIIIEDHYPKITKGHRFEFIDKKHAKSALAMAQISQLLPYFGGEVTDEEWKHRSATKYTISRTDWGITKGGNTVCHYLLAFHTEEQRDNFLKYNEILVKDYLMLD